MKLYTEEQVKYFFECGRNFQMNGEITFSAAQEALTPIELPSDDEIFKKSIDIMEEWYGNGCETEIDGHFRGAKWIKEQILNQNK